MVTPPDWTPPTIPIAYQQDAPAPADSLAGAAPSSPVSPPGQSSSSDAAAPSDVSDGLTDAAAAAASRPAPRTVAIYSVEYDTDGTAHYRIAHEIENHVDHAG